jgi:hypothetical protein
MNNYSMEIKPTTNTRMNNNIYIAKGTTVTNLKFYPMIRSADIIDSTYEPYVDDIDTRLKATVPIERGGTGKTTATDAANMFINALSTGSDTPKDADYYVAQFAGGGTTSTTYHRRPVSALWNYIKSKADSTYLGKTATATNASSDADGNNIKTSYASSASLSNNNLLLKSKSGATLSTVDLSSLAGTTVYYQTATPSSAAQGSVWIG